MGCLGKAGGPPMPTLALSFSLSRARGCWVGGAESPRKWRCCCVAALLLRCCCVACSFRCRCSSSLLMAEMASAIRLHSKCRGVPRSLCTGVLSTPTRRGCLLDGVPCALPGREDLLGCMVERLLFFPRRCPWVVSRAGRRGGWGPGKSGLANSPASGVGGAQAPRCLPPA